MSFLLDSVPTVALVTKPSTFDPPPPPPPPRKQIRCTLIFLPSNRFFLTRESRVAANLMAERRKSAVIGFEKKRLESVGDFIYQK